MRFGCTSQLLHAFACAQPGVQRQILWPGKVEARVTFHCCLLMLKVRHLGKVVGGRARHIDGILQIETRRWKVTDQQRTSC